jgi:signal transduction histidine kinase
MTENDKEGFSENQAGFVQAMLDASMNGVLLLEPVRDKENSIEDFIVRKTNNATKEHIGFAANEAIGKTMQELFPKYKQYGFFDVYTRALVSNEIQRNQLYYKDENLEGWFEIGTAAHEGSVVVAFANISNTKLYQQQIEKGSKRLDAIINRSQSGVFMFSPVYDKSGEVVDFRFTKANPALASYVGQTQDKVVGSLGSNWFPAYKNNGLFDTYKDTYITGKNNRFEFHYNDDGIDVWLDILATKLDDEVLVTFTDYTPVKKLQLQLEDSVAELQRSNADLEEFAYVASHDLQEPLRKIQYFSDRLKQMCSDNPASGPFIKRLEDATDRMRILIEDLLSYSRFSTNRRPFEAVEINELVGEVLGDLEASVTEKNASIKIEPLPVIHGDRLQLRQLFQNIISNSLKYNRPEVQLEIRITSDIVTGRTVDEITESADYNKKFYRLILTDNGLGFEQEYAKRIFKIFQRLHGRSDYPGTGVGLAIVQKVVENHDGYIYAEGVPGIGAKFIILLPVGN